MSVRYIFSVGEDVSVRYIFIVGEDVAVRYIFKICQLKLTIETPRHILLNKYR